MLFRSTEVEFASDTTTTGKFSSTRVHAVVIEDKNTLRTAWIWDVEDDESYTPGTVNKDIIVKIVSDTKIEVDLGANDMRDRAAAVIAKLTEEGYTDISIKANGTELDVTASKTVNNVTQETVFTTKTYTTTKAVGGDSVKSITELDRDANGKPIFTPGSYAASAEQVKDLIPGVNPSDYPVGDTLLIAAFNGPANGYIVIYNKDGNPVFLSKFGDLTQTKVYKLMIALNNSSRHYESLRENEQGVWNEAGTEMIYTKPVPEVIYPLPDGDYTWAVKSGSYTSATDSTNTVIETGSFTVEW